MITLTSKIPQPIILSLAINHVATQLIYDHAIAVPLIAECCFVEDIKYVLDRRRTCLAPTFT